MTKQIRHVVSSDIRWELDGKLTEVIAYLEAQLQLIPPASRESATLDFEVYDNYGSAACDVSLSYLRNETPQETDTREKTMARLLESQRVQYEALKLKFGDK